VKKRIIDVAVGLLLFASGVFVAWGCYAVSHVFAFLGMPPWWKWTPPVALGCAVAIAAIGLCFSRRLSGIVASFLMVALGIWFLPEATDQVHIGWDWEKPWFDVAAFFLTTAPLLLISALVCWRFVKAPRAKTRTI
jgi:ABC-type branched-subunit amino acid transport system permease subunit